jgi:pimeloyl-ACP methyl ester carboxylesterase
VRLHAVIGGDGPPLLLVHGWPETWYAWRALMPALARDFEVIAVDQRGIELSDKPAGGYDTGTQARDLLGLMEALGHQRFAVIGHDTGFAISYALAADHPARVERARHRFAIVYLTRPQSHPKCGNPREYGDLGRARDFAANRSHSPAKGRRLKIVVSPVRVRVSPSTKGPQICGFGRRLEASQRGGKRQTARLGRRSAPSISRIYVATARRER